MLLSPLLQYALWFTAPVLQTAIVVILWRRRLQRAFPFFFSYTALQVLNFAALFAVMTRAPKHYFHAYWTLEGLNVIAGFAVIYEIFSHAFEPYKGLRDLGNVLYRWVIVVMFLVSGVFAATSPGGDAQRIVAWVILLERVVRVMQCGLLLFVFLLCSRLGLTWRHYVVGLALGFGAFSSIELTLLTIRTQVGNASLDYVVNLAKAVSYNLAVMIWLGYLASPQPSRRKVEIQPQPDRWDYALLTLLHPNPPAFIASMEQAVERVLNGNSKSKAAGHH